MTRRRLALARLVRLALLALLALPWLTPTAARADEPDATGLTDYDPSSKAWNGMATFSQLAAGLGFEVLPVGALEWSDLDQHDILVLVYPLQRVDPGKLAAFVSAGGHVVVADDFGDAADALSRLGLLRAEVTTAEAARYYRQIMFAPIATPTGDHPLGQGVAEVVTNHPALLTQVSGATTVIGFGADRGAIVVTGERGTGRFVVISDPSILINRMMQFPGNLRLAANLLRWLDRGGRARRVVLLRGDVPMYGEPKAFIDDAQLDGLGRSLAGVNAWLEGRNEWLLTPIAMRVVGAIVAVALAALALAALPPWRRRPIDGAWLGPPARERRDLATRVVAETDAGAQNFVVPATVLRDSVNVALARAIDQIDPLYQLPERDLAARVRERFGPEAAELAARLGRKLRALPTRAHAAALWTAGKVSLRELTALSDDAHALYRALGHAAPTAPSPARTPEA